MLSEAFNGNIESFKKYLDKTTKGDNVNVKATKTKVIYIQRKGDGYLETVDEFTTRKEARAMLREYQISSPTAFFYLSSRACKGWK